MTRNPGRPPRFSEALLRLFSLTVDMDAFLGDMAEEYSSKAERQGPFRAGLWYRGQVWRSILPLVTAYLNWSADMFANYLKVAFRNLKRQKLYAVINILGLAIGMAGCLLMVLWVRDELSYDHFHVNGDRIYRVVSDWEKWEWKGIEITPGALAPLVKDRMPDVQCISRVVEHPRVVVRYENRSFYESGGISVDRDFFRMFTFPFVQGDIDSVFTAPFQVVITESFARKYFGMMDPLNRTLEMNGTPMTVCGVIRDVPEHSHLRFDYLTSMEHMKAYPASVDAEAWSAFNFVTYVMMKPGADLKHAGGTLTEIAMENGSAQVKQGARFRLQPLYDVYLDARDYERTCFQLGDRRNIWIFSIIAMFVLLIACVNFVNLATARADIRMKEVGFRKTVGAGRFELMKQFFSESLFQATLAGIGAVLLAELALPLFNRISARELRLDYHDPFLICSILILILITGLLAGIYPAMVLSAFRPIQIFRKDLSGRRKGPGFRGVLVILQFALAILLTIVTLTGYRQILFIQNRDLGFNKENVLTIPITENIGPKMDSVKEELMQSPHVVSVSPLRYLFTDTMWRTTSKDWEGRTDAMKDTVDIAFNWSDTDMMRTTGMHLVAGRGFETGQDDNAVLVNEELVRQMGFDEPVGRWFTLGSTRVYVAGVLKDAHVRSLHEAVNPHVFMLQEDWSKVHANGAILVRYRAGHTTDVIDHARKVWSRFNQVSPFEYGFMDEAYEQLYRKEYRVRQVLEAFTIFALTVACLGLFGLIAFTTRRKAREIGIRKTLGATNRSLVALFTRRFLLWVLLANLVAWPVGYYLANRMLERFTYRVDIGLSVFLISGILALALAMITVSGQAWMAASANPVDSIRDE